MILSYSHSRGQKDVRTSGKSKTSRASSRTDKKLSHQSTISSLVVAPLGHSPEKDIVSIASKRERKTDRIFQFVGRNQTVFTYSCIAVYILVGAGLVLTVERSFENRLEFARPKNPKECLSTHGYWAALFFMLATSSTIGFGNVYACTTVGRAISTVYSIIGVPMVVYILSNFGRHMCNLVCKLYPILLEKWIMFNWSRKRRKNRRNVRRRNTDVPRKQGICYEHPIIEESVELSIASIDENFNAPSSKTVQNIPTTIGFVLTITCIFIVALFYRFNEDYSVNDAAYYAFMTFLGGDYITEDYKWVVPMYSTIFLGFSMLSLTISLFQTNMERFVSTVQTRLMENVQEKIAAARAAAEDPSTVDVSTVVQEAMKKTKAPWWLKMCMPQKELDLLQDAVIQAVNKKDYGIQAQLSYQKRVYKTADNEVQCDKPAKTFWWTQTEPQNTAASETDRWGMQDAAVQPACIGCCTREVQAAPLTKSTAVLEKVSMTDRGSDPVRAKRSQQTSTHRPKTNRQSQTEYLGSSAEVQFTTRPIVTPLSTPTWEVPPRSGSGYNLAALQAKEKETKGKRGHELKP